MDAEENKDRFQNRPWYIKLWRYRYYLAIPFRSIHIWWANRDVWDDDGDRAVLFADAWGICIGSAQAKMKWYYTIEEAGIAHDFGGIEEDEKDKAREIIFTRNTLDSLK